MSTRRLKANDQRLFARISLPIAILAIALIGCAESNPKLNGPKGQVSGAVTLNGSPLKDQVTVCLISVSDGEPVLSTSDADGKFEFKYQGMPGVPCGSYKVIVDLAPAERQPSPQDLMENPEAFVRENPIPESYRDQTRTPVELTVVKGDNPLLIDIVSDNPSP